jgi:plasmid stability protein
MATITVKNIPDELYGLLKQSARLNQRSINSEIIHAIRQAVAPASEDVESMLRQARAVRELSAAYTLRDEDIRQAIDEGRS